MAPTALPYPDPPLRDGRFGLRRWAGSDLDCVREAGTDPEIPHGTTVPTPFTTAAGRAFIHRQWQRVEDGEGVSQAVVETGTDRAIGLVWVAIRPQPHVGGLGYWIVPSARGSGAATAAVRLVTPWALAALDLRRLEAWVEPANLASQRVLLRAGFEQEGLLRNFLTTAAGTSDALVFSALPTDRTTSSR
ncbi:GNAT family N-acetyltransferase [Nocardioides sp.]|uniref:GNAT family N-acetyltransferase n=1 Tax=Nocardioides sp. TaxID=35761 RepID=UPI002720791B|nr:GNAT family N-acetyltransferase [Nocardioides sp.]MDO9457623.1 GNAT family N-acetyltransferase [Nocardioides sp.]